MLLLSSQVKRDCKNGKDCPFSHDTKLREKAEKNGPPNSRSASPKGRGDKVCRDSPIPKGKLQKRRQVPLRAQDRETGSVTFSNATHTKQCVILVKAGTRWRKVKDPYQRHSSPRLCDGKVCVTHEHKENVRAHSEATRQAGDLLHEVATKRRFKPKRAWAGPGMTWVIQYDKKKDCVTNDIVMEEFKGDQIVVAMASEGEASIDGKGSDNDFGGHQWTMDTGRGSDLISKAKVEDHKMRSAKAKCPIQFETANGNTQGSEAVTTNIVEFDESIEPYVFSDTPSVLSMGRRCMHGGYHFVWLAGKHPYLITPSGKLVALAVEDDTPYHISGDPRCQPVEPAHDMSITWSFGAHVGHCWARCSARCSSRAKGKRR